MGRERVRYVAASVKLRSQKAGGISRKYPRTVTTPSYLVAILQQEEGRAAVEDDHKLEDHQICFAELVGYVRHVDSRQRDEQQRDIGARYSYEMKLGRETIQLDAIAFRILRFLASQPYRAFTRERIAEAVSTARDPVAADVLDGHVARLRDSLGFFRDYIQTVPYIGYRFRA